MEQIGFRVEVTTPKVNLPLPGRLYCRFGRGAGPCEEWPETGNVTWLSPGNVSPHHSTITFNCKEVTARQDPFFTLKAMHLFMSVYEHVHF